jgi:predicted DCC family thiol-disulfide oxidoreductase YuxK
MTLRAPDQWPDDSVVHFDGVCVFCSRWIRFVATRDSAVRFRFPLIPTPMPSFTAHRPYQNPMAR